MKAINKIKGISVENMTSSRGNDVPNQFIITTDYGRIFQSYDSIIAVIDNTGQVYLDKNTWEYSTTTGKYRNMFLGEDKKETLSSIKDGTYKVLDLNK